MNLSASMVSAALAATVVGIYAQDGHPNVKIDPKNAQIDNGDWHLSMGGRDFQCIKKGEPRETPALVDDDERGRVIKIKLGPTRGKGPDNGRDKINYTVVNGHDPDAPSFNGRATYFAFDIKLDPKEFETPTTGKEYIIAQWWQGAPFAPPLALQILPGSDPSADPEISFIVHNDETKGNPSARPIVLPMKSLHSLQRGKWYRFVVATKFGFNNDGALKVWVNSDQDEQLSWRGSIGYDPSLGAADLGFHTGKVDRRPNPRLELYFGPYRDRQESTQVFYFSNIGYGDRKISAKV